MAKDRKPIVILKIEILTNGDATSYSICRNPSMTDDLMLELMDKINSEVHAKYAKTEEHRG